MCILCALVMWNGVAIRSKFAIRVRLILLKNIDVTSRIKHNANFKTIYRFV